MQKTTMALVITITNAKVYSICFSLVMGEATSTWFPSNRVCWMEAV